MENPKDFYKSQIAKYQAELKTASRKLGYSSLLRLLVFLALVGLIYFFFGNWKIVIPVAVVGIGVFIFLVSKHSDLKYERDKLRELIKINETEIEVLNRNFQHLPTGDEFENHAHFYSQDIDLFGKGSFFQYLNRTALLEGKQKLADLLLENQIENIEAKQEAIKELAEMPEWRQNFSALASLVETETKSTNILSWLKNYKTFVPKFMSWLPWLFSAISLAVIAAYAYGFISGLQLLTWFFIGLIITGFFVKKINELSEAVSKVQDTFQQYHKLLSMLEEVSFHSEILKEKKANIYSEKEKASQVLKKFSKAIDALDQRNNLLFGAFGNGFLLWDLRQSYKLEKWIKNYADEVSGWFETIEFIDAYNSVGNFAFNHPNYAFPEIKNSNYVIKAEAAAHPLLDPEKSVRNDYEIKNEQFFIITGANMAGKSTFLRTVSLQIVMSNIGLPVCANSCEYSPIKLITSMRTTDSLSDDESYFFSELKRLKFIVDEIKTDRYFIILDEILKGTNSTDKAIGSRKFIQKLVGSKSTGIIATHDLSLCEVAEELPQVKNHYFDAEIINNELHFDYKFKTGICQNMNASFLLKKMEIV